MKPGYKIALVIISAFVAGIVSLLVTTIAWSCQIEGRAFQCNDSVGWPFDNYWTDIDTHAAAGDKLSAGWSWNDIKIIRFLYVTAFTLGWGTLTLISSVILIRREKAIQLESASAVPP